MNFINILRPTLLKVILMAILFIVGSAIFEIPIKICSLALPTSCDYYIFPNILNLIVSYVLSCFAVYGYGKMRSKK